MFGFFNKKNEYENKYEEIALNTFKFLVPLLSEYPEDKYLELLFILYGVHAQSTLLLSIPSEDFLEYFSTNVIAIRELKTVNKPKYLLALKEFDTKARDAESGAKKYTNKEIELIELGIEMLKDSSGQAYMEAQIKLKGTLI